MILNSPTWPTLSRCVPPQSSREKSPIRTTRTISGYFSPKRAIAPWVLGLFDRHVRPAYRGCLQDAQVDGLFDGAEPVAADGLGIGEVKPQSIGLDLAPGLLGVLAQDGAQGVVQQMRGRVGAPDRVAPVGVDLGA